MTEDQENKRVGQEAVNQDNQTCQSSSGQVEYNEEETASQEPVGCGGQCASEISCERGCCQQPESEPDGDRAIADEPVNTGVRPRRGVGKSGNKPDKYRKHLLCRYGKMGYLAYFSHDIADFPDKASHAIVNTERGLEIAEIVGHDTIHRHGNCQLKEAQLNAYMKNSCDNFPLDRNGTVVRVATDQDVREQKHLDFGVSKELRFCEELKTKLGLDMILVDAERLFGGERIIFYFMAEGRVDFRQLVKDLAQQYQTRIEMRQVGARDEARLVADFETCGRECCCRSFLKVLYPVNMRMAKLQKATLDPSKISGRCGRLKCCLRFEDEVYQEHKKKLPKKGMVVLTPEGHGVVVDSQVLTLLVKVHLHEGKMIALGVDEILEFNYVPPVVTEEEKKAGSDGSGQGRGRRGEGRERDKDRDKGRDRNNKDRGRRRDTRAEESEVSLEEEVKEELIPIVEVQSEGVGESEVEGELKKKKRRRRRRKKKKTGDGVVTDAGAGQGGSEDSGNDEEGDEE